MALELRIYSLDSYEALGPSTYENLIIDDGRDLRDILGYDLYSDVAAALTPLGIPERTIRQIKTLGNLSPTHRDLKRLPTLRTRGHLS